MAGALKPSLPSRSDSIAQTATRGTGLNFSKKTSRKIVDPLGLVKSSPDKPEATAAEIALERRQMAALDKEIEDEETRHKAMSRGSLGAASLLSGAPRTSAQAAKGKGGSGSSSSGGGGSSSSGGGGSGGGSLLRGIGSMRIK